jgi:hypothetical protein
MKPFEPFRATPTTHPKPADDAPRVGHRIHYGKGFCDFTPSYGAEYKSERYCAETTTSHAAAEFKDGADVQGLFCTTVIGGA